ncbi:MAG: LptA/OstA family protein [Beijerinckiaceae bacterium]
MIRTLVMTISLAAAGAAALPATASALYLVGTAPQRLDAREPDRRATPRERAARTVVAQAQPNARQANRRTDPFGGFGGNSKDPIRIDANKLEVFDKDQKAIYSGDVIAVRGTVTTRASQMTIFYDNSRQKSEGAAARPANGQAAQDGALKRIEFKGPVSVVNGTQTATAREMVYDAIAKTVTLRGNAIVADGDNVQRGEIMVYNTEASVATISNPGGRVQGVFTPGSQDDNQQKRR